MSAYELNPGQVTLSDLRQIFTEPHKIKLTTPAVANIELSAQTVTSVIKDERVVYGINTGFGLLANTRIKPEELELLQRSIVLSHAAGVGELMNDDVVRLIMFLKINSLSRGFSGIRLQVIENLITLFNAEVYPGTEDSFSAFESLVW